MNPILFDASAVDFSSLGIGVLAESVSCFVTEERNGSFELELKYPVSGKWFQHLRNRAILVASVDASGRREPFRIYKIARPMNGIVTVYAAHLSYDLSGVVLSPFSAVNAPAAMESISAYSANNNPFSFWTDKSTAANFKVSAPSTVRSIMGGQSGSLLDVYGGEYGYEGYTVKLYANRGQDRGVTIRYGKNLIDLKQEENIQNAYTGVYPYWISDEDYMELPERILSAEGSYDFTKIRPLDASSEFEEKPTESQLRSYAESYMERNEIGKPTVSISVSFVPLEQSEEYKNVAPLQEVLLCDTVTVEFEKLGVDATAKCVKTVFDVLKNRYKSIDLGDARTNITDTIVAQKDYADTAARKAVSGQTQMDIFNKLTNYGQVQGIYIQDGKWYINAEIVKVINLIADNVRATGASVLGVDQELWITDSRFRMTHGGLLRLAIQLAEDGGPGIYLIDENEVTKTRITASGIRTPSLEFTGDGNCAWEYDSTLGKTILVQT